MFFEVLQFTKENIFLILSFKHKKGKKGEPGSICKSDGSVSSIVTDPEQDRQIRDVEFYSVVEDQRGSTCRVWIVHFKEVAYLIFLYDVQEYPRWSLNSMPDDFWPSSLMQ
jgi:hypothetical protein